MGKRDTESLGLSAKNMANRASWKREIKNYLTNLNDGKNEERSRRVCTGMVIQLDGNISVSHKQMVELMCGRA